MATSSTKRLLSAVSLAAVSLAAVLAASSAAFSQNYPTKPVRIMVPFSSTTTVDIVARHLAERLTPVWGHSVVVENQAGGGGNVGANIVARSAPDGYMLMMMGLNNAINAGFYKDLPFDIVRDFRPILRVAVTPMVIVANPKFPASSVRELIAAAKSRPNEIPYGSGGNGSVGHLLFVLLSGQSGITMRHVPYKSIAPQLTDIIGGHIGLGSTAAVTATANLASAGSIKLLAVTSAKRARLFPDVPTVTEAGISNYDITTWNGLVAPARTSNDIINKIHADVVRLVQSKATEDYLLQQGMEVNLLGPTDYQSFLTQEVEKWSRLVKSSGATAE